MALVHAYSLSYHSAPGFLNTLVYTENLMADPVLYLATLTSIYEQKHTQVNVILYHRLIIMQKWTLHTFHRTMED